MKKAPSPITVKELSDSSNFNITETLRAKLLAGKLFDKVIYLKHAPALVAITYLKSFNVMAVCYER